MRLIDADKLKRKAHKLSTEAWKTNRVAKVTTILNQFIDWIEDAPTIDAVEVVRCKDCLNRDNSCGMGEHKWCGFLKQATSPNNYCSYGKRREDGER